MRLLDALVVKLNVPLWLRLFLSVKEPTVIVVVRADAVKVAVVSLVSVYDVVIVGPLTDPDIDALIVVDMVLDAETSADSVTLVVQDLRDLENDFVWVASLLPLVKLKVLVPWEYDGDTLIEMV